MQLITHGRRTALVLLVVSLIWAAAILGPLFYSCLFPNPDIRRTLMVLKGREELMTDDLIPLVQQVTDSVGKLQRAIQVGSSWQMSEDLNVKASHITRVTRASYIAWFDKRSGPILLIVTRTETDGTVALRAGEGDISGTLVAIFFPVLLFAASALWLIRSRVHKELSGRLPPTPAG